MSNTAEQVVEPRYQTGLSDLASGLEADQLLEGGKGGEVLDARVFVELQTDGL